ncbi:hypothetical protein NKJ27_29770, partial [Mesorhizobium sp. M0162]
GVAAQQPGEVEEGRGGERKGSLTHHSFAPPSVLPDISPTRGEISSFGASVLSAPLEIGENQDDG